MGCVPSRIDKEERVRICKERKRLMKQLLVYRKEFADALLAYLRALKNTGATLRQFTESDSLELEETTDFAFPPSPPPLPPSPPPPPSFSPDLRRNKDKQSDIQSATEEEITEINEDGSHTPPPPLPNSSWHYWDPFCAPSLQCEERDRTLECEEENWAETNSQFDEDDGEEVAAAANEVNLLPLKRQIVEQTDDNTSTMSEHAKDAADMGMIVQMSKKALSRIVEDLDEYFLKASAVLKNIAVIIDVNTGDNFLYHCYKENKRRRSNSTKVFRALMWSWSFKTLLSKETEALSEVGEPCKPGAHCITLKKLYSEEQKLYKDVKEEVLAKVEYGRKSLLLQRQEEERDWAKAEKTRLGVESLESYILSLQESISLSYSTLLKLINEELHPQIFALASGLMQMWQTMNRCHHVQNQISQQLVHITDQQQMEPTSEYHQQAAAQLQTEVTCLYNSFCKLVKFQRQYVSALCKWTELTRCLENIDDPQGHNSATIRSLSEEWLQELDKLPNKMVSEAVRRLLTAVETIVLQQQEEYDMHKRSDKLVRKVEREISSLSEVEMKFEGSFSQEDTNAAMTQKHPLLIRRAKVAALKMLADDEKAKYAHSVKVTRSMILNNLQSTLPNLFGALTEYTGAYVSSFDAILGSATTSEHEDLQ